MIKNLINVCARLVQNKQKLPIVYIAGQVTGLDYNQVYAKFKLKQQELERKGFFVLNPCDLIPPPGEMNWGKEMCIAIVALVCARYICLLPDWHLSKGAKVERELALVLGISTIEG
ncbi:DUF4406 domain-containing protein [Mucilaginibacter sp. RCC_168]|uniref:DUF4406 domain-containing protein n=1 Tax=Mucilaginibacter sp. RCC_168 TaxID=3239221 RepID=UPI0035261E25